jgi:hypothetical protein
MKEQKILPTITTTSRSNWRNKIKEINELGIEEVSIFPTAINKKERQEMYGLLEKSCVKSIPFVHLRNDMDIEELDYLVKNYGTKAFNTHTEREYPFLHDYSKYKDILFIENVYEPLDGKELQKFRGICLDVSHLENDRRLRKEIFDENTKTLKKFTIGCNHISGISEEIYKDNLNENRCSPHFIENLSQLDYIKNYPREYFSPFIAIELENSIKEQLNIRNYLSDIIKAL